MFTMDFLPTVKSLLESPKKPLIHRDLSWLQFNERVLEEARHAGNPLLERVKFLSISASNLDEFFMIRVASLERSLGQHRRKLDWASYRRTLHTRAAILESVSKFTSKQMETLDILLEELKKHGIHLVRTIEEGTAAALIGRRLFEEQILPKLPPPESFAIEKIAQLENLQIGIIFPGQLWIRVPRSLPSMTWSLSEDSKEIFFFFTDDLLSSFLSPTAKIPWSPSFVRLARDGDFSLDLEDTDPESIPDVVMTRLRTRDRGRPIRLQYSGDCSGEFLKKCSDILKLPPTHMLPAAGTLCLNGLWTLVNNIPDHLTQEKGIKYPPLQTNTSAPFDGKGGDIFEKLRERDYLLHHPYDSFDAFVAWVQAAATDPNVTQIEQTIYRTDALSPVMGILKEAAKTKRCRVVIELRARFDELNNLRLADELQKAGVEVAFGFGKLKLHAKVALVTRKENGGEKLYTHLSTGNYNAATARQYTDLAILTSHPEIGADARHFFDSLWRGEIPQSFKQLVVAPTRLSRRLQSHILAEAEAAKAGKKARIVAKVNALVDEGIIESLYGASQAGVQVDLIVRGACSLIPGIAGLSENIRVVSIVDRFLEHSRLYYFAHSQKMYLSSADWMPRNFFSRLEIAFPILDPNLYAYLEQVVIPAYLSDSVKARELTHQGTWRKRVAKPDPKLHITATNGSGLAMPTQNHSVPKTTPQDLRSQVFFRELALRDYKGTPLE